jgi:hypothetical protein
MGCIIQIAMCAGVLGDPRVLLVNLALDRRFGRVS